MDFSLMSDLQLEHYLSKIREEIDKYRRLEQEVVAERLKRSGGLSQMTT